MVEKTPAVIPIILWNAIAESSAKNVTKFRELFVKAYAEIRQLESRELKSGYFDKLSEE
jgi:hypothetical protein